MLRLSQGGSTRRGSFGSERSDGKVDRIPTGLCQVYLQSTLLEIKSWVYISIKHLADDMLVDLIRKQPCINTVVSCLPRNCGQMAWKEAGQSL